jgi:hypothetical protein
MADRVVTRNRALVFIGSSVGLAFRAMATADHRAASKSQRVNYSFRTVKRRPCARSAKPSSKDQDVSSGDPAVYGHASERAKERSRGAPIEDAAPSPIPASPVAPVPPRPTALGHQIDKARHADLEQAGFGQDWSRTCQHGNEGHQDHDYRRDNAPPNPDT